MALKKSLLLALAVTGSADQALAADWSGPFVGITGGYGGGFQQQHGGVLNLPSRGGMHKSASSSSASMTTTSSTFTTTTTIVDDVARGDGSYKLSGGLIGGGVGYNWQRGNFVYGLAADGSWADVSATGGCGFGGALPHSCGGGIYSLGTVRGRVGYDISPALSPFNGLMVFAAGGLAVADVHAWDGLYGASGSRVIPGWTAGGGVEALFGQHWSVTVEYLHIDLGEHGLFTAIPPNVERVRTTGDLVRVGLSYHFNTPVVPVVAKY